jgi:predicted DNA-binding protein
MKQAIFTKSLTISMPPEQYEQIKKITDANSTSMGEWVRDAIDAALEKNRTK